MSVQTCGSSQVSPGTLTGDTGSQLDIVVVHRGAGRGPSRAGCAVEPVTGLPGAAQLTPQSPSLAHQCSGDEREQDHRRDDESAPYPSHVYVTFS